MSLVGYGGVEFADVDIELWDAGLSVIAQDPGADDRRFRVDAIAAFITRLGGERIGEPFISHH